MKKHFEKLIALTQKVNRQHIQVALALLALALFVLSAGAPSDGGIICRIADILPFAH